MSRVRFFAALREITGKSQDEIDADTVEELVHQAVGRYGESFEKSLRFSKIAVNGRMISELDGHETKLEPNDEVAFLPPVSGGGFGGVAAVRMPR